MSARVLYCSHCGAANQADQVYCFACQEALVREQTGGRTAEPDTDETSPWWIKPKGTRPERWKVDQPTGPLEERLARPVPPRLLHRRVFLTGLMAGGLAAGITALAAWRFLGLSRSRLGIAPVWVAPASTPTAAELVADTNQAGRLIVNRRSDLLQLAWKPAPTNATRLLIANVSSNGGSHLYLWDSVSNLFHQILLLQATLL
ncbi:MAG TPA: zinc ribbon domain-containing protein [Ktedonobacteraceae bacterium]